MRLKLKHCRYALSGLAAIGLLLGSVLSHAIDTPWGSRINGFAQHTLLWSDNNDFITDSDDAISSNITDLGITLTHDFTRRWKFTGQVNSHKAGRTGDGNPELDFAYVQWRAVDAPLHQLNLVAGRVVLRFGFYNELRDVAHSRPSIFTPYSIYYDRFRSTVFAHDGVGFDYRYLHGFDSVRFEAAYTTPRSDSEEIDEIVPSAFFSDKSVNGQEGYYYRLSYEQPLKARYALSSIFLRWDYDADFLLTQPVALQIPVSGQVHVGSTGLSMQQHFDSLTATVELFRHHASYDDLFPGSGHITVNLNAVLLQLQSSCGPLTCFVQHEVLEAEDSDLADGNITRDSGLGVGWKLTPNLLLRSEVHYVEGTAWLNDTSSITHNRWHYMSMQIAWTF